ncbi:hypothetical protein PIB30_030037 [Stylosanthes scabra]|uniref:Uncharacterized protein n=1 Tax=Stylosanthes scabra TaxID=79078 RepID=A0ABU6SB55_9FABA|nr:hypothetical protein [Stylosanthes scabra]
MPLSPKHFPPIVNVDNTREMKGACHVCSFLLDGITKMRHKNMKRVEGCVFALLIIYMHETHFGKDSKDEKAQPPWVSYWKGETLSKRMRVEKTDSTEALASKLRKSLEIEDDPKGKKKHGRRKHVEDDESKDESEEHPQNLNLKIDSSEFESEGDSSKSESKGGSELEPDLEKTASEDEK